MYRIGKAQQRIVFNDKYVAYGRDGKELNNGRVEALHQCGFYYLQRWIKRLEDVKQCDGNRMVEMIDTIIGEMNNRSNEYSIEGTERQRLIKLARSDEETLRKYDNFFV